MNFATIFEQLRERLTVLVLRLVDFLPDLVAAILVLLAGWLLAYLARALVRRASTSLLAQVTRLQFVGRGPASGLVHEAAPDVIAGVTFWVVLLVFAAVAVEQLRIQIIAQLFARLAQYLPNLVLALGILLAGVILGAAARHAIESAARTAAMASAVTLGRLAQASVVTAVALVAADQIGVESTLLIVAFAITVGSVLGGLALAFGIGSGPMVGNLIAARNLQKLYHVGQSVRIGQVEGRIVEMRATMVAIDTADGTVYVPARRFSEETSVLVREQGN